MSAFRFLRDFGFDTFFDTDPFEGFNTFRDVGKGRAKSYRHQEQLDADEMSYEQIKARCLESGILWEDPDFPAEPESLFYENPPNSHPYIDWKRPTEFCSDPHYIKEGVSQGDINQGELGNCWFLAAVACVATNEKLLARVIHPEQSFTEDYAGIFRFEFWQYGRWVEVCVDDRLPVSSDDGKSLVYIRPEADSEEEMNEFWMCLLEKAYAKLYGTYENLCGGYTSEALTDLTGSVVERIALRDKTPEGLLQRMLKARRKGCLMGCHITPDPNQTEALLPNGLVMGHAYSITGLQVTDTSYGSIPLVRIRNPWGNEREWNGAWSDKSDEWNSVSEDERQELGLTLGHDGEFWMSYEDFTQEFEHLEICYLGPDSIMDGLDDEIASEIDRWEGSLMEGQWKSRYTAGGCLNYKSFYVNPQYKFTISEPDEDDEDGLGCVVISIMQKDRRKMLKEGKSSYAIGYVVLQLDEDQRGTLDLKYLKRKDVVAKNPVFGFQRQCCNQHKLPPGTYVVVPSTFEPNQEADFVVRIYQEREEESLELDEETSLNAVQEEDELDGDDTVAEMIEAAKEAFIEHAGEDGEIDAGELQQIINDTYKREFDFSGFSEKTCNAIIEMKDHDGKLNFEDFLGIQMDLKYCCLVMNKVDEDKNGYFDSYEFKNAFRVMGIRMSNRIFPALIWKYQNDEGHIEFDEFVCAYMTVKGIIQKHEGADPQEIDVAIVRSCMPQ